MADLTKNQALVLARLEGQNKAQSAYDLLDHLRAEGLRAPLQIYRALEKLQALGLVHRLESLNAYVACSHSHCASSSKNTKTIAFAICDHCGLVAEIANHHLSESLKDIGSQAGFAFKSSIVELHGDCSHCSARQLP